MSSSPYRVDIDAVQYIAHLVLKKWPALAGKEVTVDHYDAGERVERVLCIFPFTTPYVDPKGNKNIFVFLHKTEEIKETHFSDKDFMSDGDEAHAIGVMARIGWSRPQDYAHVYTGTDGVRVHLVVDF